ARAEVGGLVMVWPGGLGGQEVLSFDETVQVGVRHRPGVALVLHEAVHDGDRAASSIFLQLDSSKQGRGVRERDCLCEKMADLDFRVEARLEGAKELDDIGCSDKNCRS